MKSRMGTTARVIGVERKGQGKLLSQAGAVEIRLQRQPRTSEAMAHLVAMLLQVPASVKQRLLSISDLHAYELPSWAEAARHFESPPVVV